MGYKDRLKRMKKKEPKFIINQNAEDFESMIMLKFTMKDGTVRNMTVQEAMNEGLIIDYKL